MNYYESYEYEFIQVVLLRVQVQASEYYYVYSDVIEMRSLDHKNRRRAPHDDFVIIIVPELVKHLEPTSQLQQVVGPVPASSSRVGAGGGRALTVWTACEALRGRGARRRPQHL